MHQFKPEKLIPVLLLFWI